MEIRSDLSLMLQHSDTLCGSFLHRLLCSYRCVVLTFVIVGFKYLAFCAFAHIVAAYAMFVGVHVGCLSGVCVCIYDNKSVKT